MRCGFADGGSPQSHTLLASDAVLPAQFFAPVESWTPEKRLLFAVLIEAWRTLVSRSGRSWRRRTAEARAWFCSEADAPFTFVTACHVLNLDPGRTRQHILSTSHVPIQLPQTWTGQHNPVRRAS